MKSKKKTPKPTAKSAPRSAAVAELTRLARRDGGWREVARVVGTDEGTLRSWVRAKNPSKPTAAAKAAVAARYPSAPVSAWDEPATSARTSAVSAVKREPPPPPLPPLPDGATPREGAEHEVRSLRREIDVARAEGASQLTLSRLRHDLSTALRTAARISGQLEVSQAAILRSPEWTRIKAAEIAACEEMCRVFGDQGIALVRAFQKALDRLVEEGG